MAAAKFKSVLKFVCADGATIQYPCTVSDVNAEYYVFQDSNNDVVLPSNHGNLALTDVILSAAGTDTTTASIFCNGKETGEKVMNAANLTTNLSRQFMGSPLVIAPGARIRIKQET